jgi:predicted metal-dependent phosphoesterase TrpH
MRLRCLFHIHTKFSFDSFLSPRKVVSKAREAGADVLIVTDHETIRGSEEVAALAGGNPRYIIQAGEYKTEKGDVIGLFLKKEILSRESNEVVREIHQQGGLVVLPHPYKGHTLDRELLDQMDLIESYNARCSPSENEFAVELAGKLNKPVLGGCDAHCAAEIGTAITELCASPHVGEEELRDAMLTAPRKVQAHAVSKVYQPYSQMIKACKTRNVILFLSQAKRMASVLATEIMSQ